MAHLTSFTVENFKRFEHFEMNNIGQFNLIVGDNNVGKTSVLEALLVDANMSVFRARLITVLTEFRNLKSLTESFWYSFVNRVTLLHQEQSTIFTLEYGNESQSVIIEPVSTGGYKWVVNGVHKTALMTSNDIPMQADGVYRFDGIRRVHVPLIPFGQAYFNELARIYSAYFQRDDDKVESLLKSLSALIPDIKALELDNATSSDAVLYVRRKSVKTSMPLALLGDGALRLVRIAFEMELHKEARLMVDEIDAGLHISHLQDFWRKLITLAISNNVQLFATTHNLECLQVFKEVLEEPEMQEYQARARCFTLIDSPVTKRVEAICSTFPQFEAAMQNGTELRGGAVI